MGGEEGVLCVGRHDELSATRNIAVRDTSFKVFGESCRKVEELLKDSRLVLGIFGELCLSIAR